MRTGLLTIRLEPAIERRLARAVPSLGQLGVVSGTGLDTLFVRRLQEGDLDGSLRRAMAEFPIPEVCANVLERYFRATGRAPGRPYRALAKFQHGVDRFRQQITVLANFVEVWLAKDGHANDVGINLLSKIQLPNPASLYGAMLAGVDVVLVGAGIPREIPRVLDELAAGRRPTMRLEVAGAAAEKVELDPHVLGGDASRPLRRPVLPDHLVELARDASGPQVRRARRRLRGRGRERRRPQRAAPRRTAPERAR